MTAEGKTSPNPGWWILFWRFVTRAFLDDDGSPSIWPFLAVYYVGWWTSWVGGDPPPAVDRMRIVALFGALILVVTAAIKLGAGIIVPIAEAFAQALGKIVAVGGRVVSLGVSAAESVKTRIESGKRTDYEPTDRLEPLGQTELARPENVPPNADPLSEDERG